MATKEKEIDGIKFSVTPFRSVEGLRLKSFLIKKFGPALGQALGTLKDGLPENGNVGDIRLDGEALSHAIEKLMEQLGEDDFIALIKRLFQNVVASFTKEGKYLQLTFADQQFDTSMDAVFSGKLFSVYPVMLFVLEVNYPDFFGKTAQLIGQRIKKIATSEPGEKSMTSESTE